MSMMRRKNVPALRFPEFEGEWVETEIGDLFEFKNGLNKGKEFFGRGTPIINFMDVYTLTAIRSGSFSGLVDVTKSERDRFSARKGDVFFTRTSETIDDIGMSATLVDDIPECVFSGFVLRARPKKKGVLSHLFAAHSFNTPLIRREIVTKSSMTTRALTSGTLLSRVRYSYPQDSVEQQKISALLGAVDEKIGGLEKKKALLEAYKRGVTQKLFSRALRFKDDQGRDFPNWEEKRLGELASKVSNKNRKTVHTRVLTNSALRGIVDQGDYFDHDVANSENLGGYYVVEKGDFVYNPRISGSAPVGPIKRNDLGVGVMSPLYTVFRFDAPDTEFWVQYFGTTTWHRYMEMVANYGARHDRMAISLGDFMDMPLPLPCEQERKKIVEILSSLNSRIEAVSKVMAEARRFKKGLLQQMFV